MMLLSTNKKQNTEIKPNSAETESNEFRTINEDAHVESKRKLLIYELLLHLCWLEIMSIFFHFNRFCWGIQRVQFWPWILKLIPW